MRMEFYEAIPENTIYAVRVVVYENPFARIRSAEISFVAHSMSDGV